MSVGGVGSCSGGGNYPSIAEMQQKMFNRMDQDGDGLISKTEFQTAAAERAKKKGQSLDVDALFAHIDTNQDGAIDKSENDAAMEEMHKHHSPPPGLAGSLAELLGQIFSAMDTNQDGVVDETEYKAAMEQIAGNQDGSTAAAASSSGTADSSTATASTTGSAADNNNDNNLLALLQQLLQGILNYEKNQTDQASSGSKASTSINSYA